MNKLIVTRGSLIKSVYGGYARIVEDGVLKHSVYVKKNTVYRVNTINLYTNTVIVVEEATKKALSLEYDYVIHSCELFNNDK